MGPTALIASPQLSVADVIADRSVRSVYQPIVDLADRSVVGYEALARGPEGTAFESPGALFGDAARRGVTCELDELCRERALEVRWRAACGRPRASSSTSSRRP